MQDVCKKYARCMQDVCKSFSYCLSGHVASHDRLNDLRRHRFQRPLISPPPTVVVVFLVVGGGIGGIGGRITLGIQVQSFPVVFQMLFQQFRLSAHAPLENVPHLKREQRERTERKREKEREKARESERDQCVRW